MWPALVADVPWVRQPSVPGPRQWGSLQAARGKSDGHRLQKQMCSEVGEGEALAKPVLEDAIGAGCLFVLEGAQTRSRVRLRTVFGV